MQRKDSPDDRIRGLLSDLRAGLATIYDERLKGLYLYGSYARGDQDSGSDVDVLIVVDRVNRYEAEIDRSSSLVSELSLKYGVSISRVFVSEDAWVRHQSPFLTNVRAEAVLA